MKLECRIDAGPENVMDTQLEQKQTFLLVPSSSSSLSLLLMKHSCRFLWLWNLETDNKHPEAPTAAYIHIQRFKTFLWVRQIQNSLLMIWWHFQFYKFQKQIQSMKCCSSRSATGNYFHYRIESDVFKCPNTANLLLHESEMWKYFDFSSFFPWKVNETITFF